MKTILIVTSLYEQGAQKIVTNIAVKTASYGYEFEPVVISILGGYYQKTLKEHSIPTFVLFEKGIFRTIGNFLACFGYLMRHRKEFSVANAFLPYAGFLGVILKLILWIPLIYSIRFSPSLSFGFHKRRLLFLTHSISMLFADFVTCNSPHVFEGLKRKYPSKRITYISNGISLPTKPSAQAISETRSRFFRPQFSCSVVTTCNLRDKGKDIDTLLQVAERLKEFQFIVVGGGKRLEELIHKAEALGLLNVTFTGHQDDVWPFLFSADIFIFLTLSEGFPNSVIEAMAAGLPVIASDIPQIREILDDDKECLLVKNGNVDHICGKITRLCGDAILRNVLIENSIEKIKKEYSEKQMISKFYNVCKDVQSLK
jgi:glycosyltransferase involved in cell wall biosynthesis